MGVFLPTTDTSAPAPPKDVALASLVDDSPQKRLMAQKATPPPSPLLSELLKKGNLISASPRLVILRPSNNPIHTHKGIHKFALIRPSSWFVPSGGGGGHHWEPHQRRPDGHRRRHPSTQSRRNLRYSQQLDLCEVSTCPNSQLFILTRTNNVFLFFNCN